MRIAVPYDNGEIFQHFGHTEVFAIYDYESADVAKCTKRLVETGDRHGHKDMAELLHQEKIDAVICGNIGAEAVNMLLSFGIVPVAGYCGSADDASDMLILGTLPIYEGGGMCSGGCGGCSGCHHDEEEDEDGGCGCGGCCH